MLNKISEIIRKNIQRFVKIFGYRIIKIPKGIVNFDAVVERNEKFQNIYKKCKEYTMTSKERMYALYEATLYIINSKIPGDFVECGVWKGGSAMLIAFTLLEENIINRRIYLYDTFEGTTKPTEQDYRLSDTSILAIQNWDEKKKKFKGKWGQASLIETRKNMYTTGYPENKIIFVKGIVEKTIPGIVPNSIALLRLDTDWYNSTKHELIHLYPLITKSGVLLIDDYGHWAGAKQAVDEYFLDKPILLDRIDYSGRIGIKVEEKS